MTPAPTVAVEEFFHRQQWIDHHGAKKAWGVGMKGTCVSRRSYQGAEGKVLPWQLNA
jgi:hypothetical protein